MNFAIIKNGIVSNLYVSETALNPADIQTDTAQIGWTYENGVFIAPSQPLPQPLTMQHQIILIEGLQTSRMVRAAINPSIPPKTFPSTDPNFPNMTDAQALASIETRVQALRAQLKTTN